MITIKRPAGNWSLFRCPDSIPFFVFASGTLQQEDLMKVGDRLRLSVSTSAQSVGPPSTPSMRRLVVVKGGTRNFQLMGCCDRASIRTRLTSLRTRCSMKFDLAALLSRPLRAGRGLAVAANSVCPFAVSIPDPSPDTSIPASAASGCLRFEGRQGARSGYPLSLLSVMRFRSARSRPGRAERGEANP